MAVPLDFFNILVFQVSAMVVCKRRWSHFNIERYVATMVGPGRRELLTAKNSGIAHAQAVHSKAIFEIMRLHQPSQE